MGSFEAYAVSEKQGNLGNALPGVFQEFLKQISEKKQFSIQIKRQSKSKLLNKTKESSGTLYIRKPSELKIEFTSPVRQVIYLSPQQIVTIDYMEDPKDPAMVMKGGGFKSSKIPFLELLLNPQSAMDNARSLKKNPWNIRCKTKSSTTVKSFCDVAHKVSAHSINRFKIELDQKHNLSSVSYVDSQKNEVKYLLNKINDEPSLPKNFFVPEIPKNAEITQMEESSL